MDVEKQNNVDQQLFLGLCVPRQTLARKSQCVTASFPSKDTVVTLILTPVLSIFGSGRGHDKFVMSFVTAYSPTDDLKLGQTTPQKHSDFKRETISFYTRPSPHNVLEKTHEVHTSKHNEVDSNPLLILSYRSAFF
ncbi:unnamed protein product [Leuciscus chuanchicus]